MLDETSQSVEIRCKPNPWLYGLPLFLAANAVSTQPSFLGYVIPLTVFIALAAWWLTRTQATIISFEKREATFVRSELNPFQKRKVVSLAGFSRVYATPFYRNAGWSIHMSGPKGEHLLLARIPSPFAPTLRNDYVRSLCAQIASGLQIADGGGG
jgi:hypothetical protein